MTPHTLVECPCGASVIWGDAASEAEVATWAASHRAHRPILLVVVLTGGEWSHLSVGLDSLADELHPTIPALRGRNVEVHFVGEVVHGTAGDVLDGVRRSVEGGAGATITAERWYTTVFLDPAARVSWRGMFFAGGLVDYGGNRFDDLARDIGIRGRDVEITYRVEARYVAASEMAAGVLRVLLGLMGARKVTIEHSLASPGELWVGAPRVKSSDGHNMAERVFAEQGIGVLEVDSDRVTVKGRPAFNRRAEVQRVRRYLRPEHKTFKAAGSTGGGHWTEFKSYIERLRIYLAAHPGADIKATLADVEHHYSSDAVARSQLVKLIERGVVKGVRMEREGRRRLLFADPKETL